MQNQWHITPKKISLMYKNSPDIRWKSESQEGSYFHLWWSCKTAKQYWSDIHTEFKHRFVSNGR